MAAPGGAAAARGGAAAVRLWALVFAGLLVAGLVLQAAIDRFYAAGALSGPEKRRGRGPFIKYEILLYGYFSYIASLL